MTTTISDGKTCYHEETPERVKQILELCRLSRNGWTKYRVHLFYGDTETTDFERVHKRKPDPGHDWNDENDVTGYVGRSTGLKPIPLLIHNSRSYGGGAIMDDCIVRIIVNGQELYRHPNYHSDLDAAMILPSELAHDGYTHAVVPTTGQYAGQEIARFHSERSANNWLAFMTGQRMCK